MQCRDFREVADSYLSDELLIETNHDMIAHLEECADCRRELAARREVRSKLRSASLKAPENQMRPEFAERFIARLHARAMNRGARVVAPVEWRSSVTLRRASWVGLAACLLIAAGFGLVLLRQRFSERSQANAQQQKAGNTAVATQGPSTDYSLANGPALSVNLVRTELGKSAVGDHRDCAIDFRLPEKPIALEEAGRKYDPVYLNLTKAVFSQGDSGLAQAHLIEAHSCVFEGRRFAHLVFRFHGRTVSLLVTDVHHTEPNAAESRSLRNSAAQVIACSQFSGYQVSCFETAHHAVFVVSDLPEGENLAFARNLAPAVFAHITRVESGARG